MSITYPISLPTTPGYKMVKASTFNAVAAVISPFSLTTQVQKWPGELLTFEIQLPPMAVALAQPWIGALGALKGQYGTCLFYDHSYQGALGVATGTPLVSGTNNARAEFLNTKGWTHGVTGILKAGDRISIGSGVTTRMYIVLTDANSDGSGNATLDIFPNLRETLSDGAAIDLTNPQGTFRLLSNTTSWSVDQAKTYGISFSLVEAI